MGRCQINNLFLNHRGREAPMRGHIGNATGIFDSTLPYSRLVRIFRRLAGRYSMKNGAITPRGG